MGDQIWLSFSRWIYPLSLQEDGSFSRFPSACASDGLTTTAKGIYAMIMSEDDPASNSCHLTDGGGGSSSSTHYSTAPGGSAKPRPSPIPVPPPEAFTLPDAMPTPTLRHHRCASLPASASPATAVKSPGSGRYSLPPRLLEGVAGEAWYWSHMSREQCAERLQREGNRGEYVVRINDRGECVMSVW